MLGRALMRALSLRPPVAVLSMLVLVSLVGSPCAADTPILADSFRPSTPGHGNGDPVDGATLERGHGRWRGTGGLYFQDGRVRGGGDREHARFRFMPIEHRGTAKVFIETALEPGRNGWAAVGFVTADHAPLTEVAQLWIKIDHNSRVVVGADGVSLKLYRDTAANPLVVQGANEVRLEYNRRTNSARAWLNGVELPLGDLDATGFVPSIEGVAFQLKNNDPTLKALDGPGIGGVTTGVAGAVLGDQFTTGPGRGVVQGDPLDGVAVQFGTEVWSATPSVGFGPGYATNIGLDNCLATLPFDPDDQPGYAVSSIEAMVNPAREGLIAIGFSQPGAGSFTQDGAVWARLLSTGVLQVYALGTSEVIFDDTVAEPEAFSGGIPIKLAYHRLTGEVRVDLGELEMGIEPVIATLPAGVFPLTIGAGGFEAYRSGGFTSTNQFAVDDLAIHVSEDIPVLAITQHPQSVETVFGSIAEFHCAAEGGVPPYTFEWQEQGASGETETWDPLVDGVNGISAASTPDLVVYPVTFDNDDRYRCLVRDSNSVPGEAPSAEAQLLVKEPITTDAFTTGGSTGRAVGSPIAGTDPEFGYGPWSATASAVFGDGVLTNAVTTNANVLAEVPVTSSMTDTFNVLSTSARVLVGGAEWVGVGFSTSALQTFTAAGSGQLWVRVVSNGRVKVHANSTVIFDAVILDSTEIQQPVAVRVDYDADAATPRVWVNGDELTLGATAPLGPFGAAGVNARKTSGFASAGMLQVDDFALSGSDEFPPPSFTQWPQSHAAVLGSDVTLTCAAEGGIAPLEFRWIRSGGAEIFTGGPYTVVPGGGTSSTLTISGLEPSLNGGYLCTVTDSRYGDPRPVGSYGSIYTILPDFNILWRRTGGEWVHVADVFRNSVRQAWLEAGGDYEIEVVVSGGSEVDPRLSFPVTIYGDCHPPGHEYQPPYSLLGSVMAPGGSNQVPVPIRVPEGCLGGGDWAVLSLIADVNAVEDPNRPLLYPSEVGGGQPYLPESDFSWENRWALQSWIPVVTNGEELTTAVGTNAIELEFDSQGDLPESERYPMVWTSAHIQPSDYQDTLFFHLTPWTPCIEVEDAIPSDYRPYMVWTEAEVNNYTPAGAMTRHRMGGAYAGGPDSLYLGYKTGQPPEPGVDLYGPLHGTGPVDPGHAAQLGPTGGDDSANLLGWAFNRQYHVLVWNGTAGAIAADPGPYDHTDGVATIETPVFPGGTVPSGVSTWFYLGYYPAALTTWGAGIPCDILRTEWYYLDSIRLWGTIDTPPSIDVLDYEAGAIYVDESLSGSNLVLMPPVVVADSSLRTCLEIQGIHENNPAPEPPQSVWFEFGTWCQEGQNEPDFTSGPISTEVVGIPENGRSVHCLVDPTSDPVNTYLFPDVSGVSCGDPAVTRVHAIRACLEDPEETPDFQGNNCTLHSFQALPMGCPIPLVALP
jgi:hypothetical protein